MHFIVPGQQGAGAFQRADTGAVLHHLKHAFEITSLIAHRGVEDVDKGFRFVNPEFGFVLFAGAELLDDFLNEVNTLSWMAVLHFAADDIGTTWEDTMFCVGIELHQLIFVDVRQIDGHVLKQ